jgi:hypothetical protein
MIPPGPLCELSLCYLSAKTDKESPATADIKNMKNLKSVYLLLIKFFNRKVGVT